MTILGAEQMERANWLLTSEGSSASDSAACAAAAGRVYEKLDAQLTPLLGRAGFQALLARTAKLANAKLAPLAGALEDAAQLSARLQSLEPTFAAETAAVLFGTFLDLIATFIGDRLTVQVLRRSWPAIDETSPGRPQNE